MTKQVLKSNDEDLLSEVTERVCNYNNKNIHTRGLYKPWDIVEENKNSETRTLNKLQNEIYKTITKLKTLIKKNKAE